MTPQKQPDERNESPKLVPKLRLTLPKDFKPVDSNESSSESDEEVAKTEKVEENKELPTKINEPTNVECPIVDQQPVDETDRVVTENKELEEVEHNLEKTSDELTLLEPIPENEVFKTPEQEDQSLEPVVTDDGIELADEYTQLHDLGQIQPLDKINLVDLLRACLQKTVPFCLYCYHARRIAVNGKGLALHLLASHRFQAIADSITAEELKPDKFVAKFKASLEEMQTIYLNLDTYCSIDNQIQAVDYPREVFHECMQCRFTTGTHKELYVHNRKLHLRTKLICIMCKIPFYSFCDLICHMCPGTSNQYTILDFQFRCCLCNLDHIPSAFRLMIHLRRRHFACDVCVEVCHNVVRLSSHVWKHKLHHLCYRCGIAYRNKADIQKHLFWRHGTESVLCKKCLQKKWPHVYHFCMPPSVFNCEICGQSFSRAVSLRVHKRIHNDEFRYPCTEEGCDKKFVSKKLLLKHVARHNEPPPEPPAIEPATAQSVDETQPDKSKEDNEPVKRKSKKRRKKDDITDLINFSGPNLSESDSSDESDTERLPLSPSSSHKAETRLSVADDETKTTTDDPEKLEVEPEKEADKEPEHKTEGDESEAVSSEIWERFKSFQESQGKSLELIKENDKSNEETTLTNEVDKSKSELVTIDQGTRSPREAGTLISSNESTLSVDSIDKMDESQDLASNSVETEEKTVNILSNKVLDEAKPDTEFVGLEETDENLYKTFKPKLFTCQSDHDYCVMSVPDVMVQTMDDFESEIQVSFIYLLLLFCIERASFRYCF